MVMEVVSPAVGHGRAVDDGGMGDRVLALQAEEGMPGMGVKVNRAAAAPIEGVTGGDRCGRGSDEAEEGPPKWLGHYSSTQSILLVGEGNFSFSLALATAFGSGAYLVATSLDTYEALGNKFCKAESNVMGLERLGATVLHGIDVNTMKSHADLKRRRFDRIVYNFPHAGFKGKEFEVQMINLHKELVRGFFQSAHHLLQPYGEIHVNHKTGASYDRWEIERLAAEFSLILVEKVGFQKADYPGYNQKKGDGPNCDKRGDLKKEEEMETEDSGQSHPVGISLFPSTEKQCNIQVFH